LKTFLAPAVEDEGFGLAEPILSFVGDGIGKVLFKVPFVPLDATMTLEELLPAVAECE
jgi:hypothetical protein